MVTDITIPHTDNLRLSPGGVIGDDGKLIKYYTYSGSFWINLPILKGDDLYNITMPYAGLVYILNLDHQYPLERWSKLRFRFRDKNPMNFEVSNLIRTDIGVKVCFKCGIEKPLTEYYKHKRMTDGHLNKCKECNKSDVKVNLIRVGNGYDFSEKGVVRIIYKTQKRNQIKRGFGELPYSKAELSTWLYNNNFKALYDSWVASGNNKDLKPSVDRIDDFKGYSFDNIRLTTWKVNREKQYQDMLTGTGTSGAKCKAVLKSDKSGKVLKRYISYRSAGRDIGYNIESYIKYKTPCKCGFYWSYE